MITKAFSLNNPPSVDVGKNMVVDPNAKKASDEKIEKTIELLKEGNMPNEN